MRSTHRTSALLLRKVSFVALSAMVAGGAVAATGSTDMYAPDGIAASFGTASAMPVLASDYNGSTNMYGVKGFRASFGRGGSLAQAVDVSRGGSTDIYAVDDFRASFGAPASPTADPLTVSR
jgi:hypothetical protein